VEDLFGEIVVAVVATVVAAVWRKIESGRLKAMLRAVIVGVEKASVDMPAPDQAVVKTVKRSIREEAKRTKAQDRLHKLVKEVTK